MNQKTLQNKQSFKTNLNTKEFEAISIKTIEELGLKPKYRFGGLRSITFSKVFNLYLFQIDLIKLKFIYKGNHIEISEITSFKKLVFKNKQSKLIEQFIKRFKSIEVNYLKSQKKEIGIEESFENWAGYIISDKLPPIKSVQKKLKPLLISSIITSILIGFLWAFFFVKTIYIIFLYEMIASFIIIFIMNKGIRKSNYSKHVPVKILLLGTITLAIFLNEYFQFLYYLNSIETKKFLDFLQLKLDIGITIDNIHYEETGLKILFLIRILFVYWVTNIFIDITIYDNKFKHIPNEVHDLVTYNLLKGKTDNEVKNILFEKGWITNEDQNEVLKAME